ncbi:hypothetical protein FOL47_005210 [Perkinsus chesapeaki]|uniref:Uncharacterized protein n=1 Tax=Perkinsus chesapeaki TaxID=330153 RepID=A0A7J6LZA5_PERCH|nr:hypothetical protein FOL47_005210 [Perkinsus chesapeaki]
MLPSTRRIISTLPARLVPAALATISRRGLCTTRPLFAQEEPKPEDPSTESPRPKRPWTATSLFLYGSGIAASGWVMYCAYQSGGSPHKTEIMIEDGLKRLPLYKPPERPEAEKLSRVDQHGLDDATMKDLGTWFMAEDKKAVDGVSRSMVLDFVGESLGLLEPEEAEMEKEDDLKYPRFGKEMGKKLGEVTKAFVHKGHGRLDEQKRQSGCSVSDTAEFLSSVIAVHGDDTADKVRERLHDIVEKNYKNVGPTLSIFQNPMNIPPPREPMPEVDEAEATRAVLQLELEQYEAELADGDVDKDRKKWLQNEIEVVKELLKQNK